LRTVGGASVHAQQADVEAARDFFLARSQAQAGNRDAAIATLTKCAELGDGFLPARELGFEKVWDDPRFQKLRGEMEAKLPRLDYAPVAFEVDDARLIPEGIASDQPSHSFFLGGISEGKI